MTRKDYQLIANAIREVKDIAKHALKAADRTIADDALDAVAARLARELAKDNPRFDADRFLSACEL